ncbi:MAG: hydroxymethylbilane synthase, partial [Planctomycetota bacterium]|nr:hydroxymethylbilane synthase [Planctomycetota bacterium]
MRAIRVGTRKSELALRQAGLILDAIKRLHPGLRGELAPIATTGDRQLDRPLDAVGGKGLFVKELEEALARGEVDVCVHSYKDLPVPGNPDLPVAAVSAREDPRDVLVLPAGRTEPDPDLPLGSSSRRRTAQLAGFYPGWSVKPIRGNISTRLRKLDEGGFGGLILAAAGLKRLGLWSRAGRVFSTGEMIP